MTKIKMPEPVAVMWKDRHGGRMMPTVCFDTWPPFEPLDRFDALITTDQAEAYAADKVREALEEAAQTCEARIGTGDAGIDTSDCDEEAQECAVAIRALIPKEPP